MLLSVLLEVSLLVVEFQVGVSIRRIYELDRGGCKVEDFCNHIHRSLVKDVKYVLVWGASSRHYPQTCGLSHFLHDEDVVQIVKKKETDEASGTYSVKWVSQLLQLL